MVNPPKILLVTPPCLDARINNEDAGIVPIGLYYIAALMIKNGFHTRILNLADPAAPPEAFEHQIRSMPPDIVAFSVTNPSRWPAIDLARKASTLLPDAAIVFGGPAATFLASHLLEICPEIDFIVKGEGEMTFLELARVLAGGEGSKALEKIHGLVFERSGKIVETPDRELITDLDALPHPSQYFVFQHLAMSRGCPGSCTFCGSAGFWKNRAVRSHSAAWFAAEIEQLHQNGVRHFYISDDTFTMDRGQVLALCSMIRKKNLQITWNAISRADYVDEELLEAMRTAGCIQISYGVESGSEKIRKTLGKPISNEKVKQAFSMTRACGILPRAYFIYGSPGETDQTIRESMDLLLEIQPLSAVFYMLTVFPGTALYRQALRKNRISETVWEEKIEDLPWFETDPELDFNTVKAFGDRLRDCFYSNLNTFVANIRLKDTGELSPFHADFLSRLAMTFSHGEYAGDNRVNQPEIIARDLFQKALSHAPDARAFLGLAMLAQKQRQFDTAINHLEQGLDHWPRHPDLITCMGTCLMNTGDFDHALDWFERLENPGPVNGHIEICRQRVRGKKK